MNDDLDWMFDALKESREIDEKIGDIQKEYKIEAEIANDEFCDGDTSKEEYEARIEELNKILDSKIDALEQEYHVNLQDKKSW